MRKSSMGKNQYKKKVLVVEDDRDFSTVLTRKLKQLNLDVTQIYNGSNAKQELAQRAYDLVLMDIGLPDASGHKIISSMRDNGIKTPMIMITSHSEKDEQISSYQSGANLFHGKPVDFDLLESQIKGLLSLHAPQNVISIADLVLDADKRILVIEENEYDLSFKEFELVKLLLSSPGQIYSREQLIRHTFKGVYEPQPSSVDTLISRLRKKIGANADNIIETVHGVGFRLGAKYANAPKG